MPYISIKIFHKKHCSEGKNIVNDFELFKILWEKKNKILWIYWLEDSTSKPSI